jgi:XRE family transcriptional regulator, fatty acid utilization regulator
MPRTTSSPADAAAVGHTLRVARQRIGLSQTALADRLNVSPAYINKVEAGRANLTIGALAQLSTALGCRVEVQLVPLDVAERSAADALVSLA